LRGRQRAGNCEEHKSQSSKQSHSVWVASHHRITIYQILTQSLPRTNRDNNLFIERNETPKLLALSRIIGE
jgi:hypothetical protein